MAKLSTAGKTYDIDANFQNSLDVDLEPRDPCEVREGCEDQNDQKDESIDKRIIETENESDNISKENDANQNTFEKAKGEELHRPIAQPSQLSHPSHIDSNIYRIGTTDSFGCPHCKLKGDRFFMQEHNCEANDANELGKGPISFNS